MEMKDFCRSLIKFLFILFNFVAAVMGLVIVVLGIVALVTGKFLYIANFNWISLPIFLMLIGIVLMAFTGMGILGSLCESKFILIIYSFGLLACDILLIIGAISGFIWKGNLESGVYNAIDGNLNRTVYSSLIDDIQHYEQCCGLHNYSDWFNTNWANSQNNSFREAVPLSCCKDETHCLNGLDGKVFSSNDVYSVGCYAKLLMVIDDYLYAFAIVVFLFALFMLIGTGVAWYLVCTSSSSSSSTSKSWFTKEKGYETV